MPGSCDGRYGFFFPASREMQSIAARRIEPIEEGPPLLEAADVVEDDRGGGRRVGEGGDVRGPDDARVMPERVVGGQRLLAEDVEHRRRDLPGGKYGEQIRFDEMSAARGVD